MLAEDIFNVKRLTADPNGNNITDLSENLSSSRRTDLFLKDGSFRKITNEVANKNNSNMNFVLLEDHKNYQNQNNYQLVGSKNKRNLYTDKFSKRSNNIHQFRSFKEKAKAEKQQSTLNFNNLNILVDGGHGSMVSSFKNYDENNSNALNKNNLFKESETSCFGIIKGSKKSMIQETFGNISFKRNLYREHLYDSSNNYEDNNNRMKQSNFSLKQIRANSLRNSERSNLNEETSSWKYSFKKMKCKEL